MRSTAEIWKEKYEQLNDKLEAAQENNDYLESSLFRVREELAEKYEKQKREIISKQELEKEDLLKKIKELSNCT